MAQPIPQVSIDAVLDNIANYQISGVVAGTGTGKSTTLMTEILNVGTPEAPITIFSVQPTVLAVNGLFQRQTKLLGKDKVSMAAESVVQYNNDLISKIRGNQVKGKQHQLVYCTNGHIRHLFFSFIFYCFNNKRITSPHKGKEAFDFAGVDLKFCDILVIDEVHGGTMDCDVIMYLYRYMFKAGAILPRLLLSSATLDIVNTPFPDAPIHQIQMKSFDVSIEYHHKTYTADRNELYVDTGLTVQQKHLQNPVPQGQSDVWMVFCPGAGEVEMIKNGLTNVPGIETLSVYGGADKSEVDKIYSVVPNGIRRIIIATNIAEASITISDISGIFDTMTEKYTESSASDGSRLSLYKISKSSAKQRAGRTGRTRPGFCYRMGTEEEYSTLPESRVNEIKRVPIHSIILEALEAGLTPTSLFSGAVPMEQIKRSLHILHQLDMFTPQPLSVTARGKFATKFPTFSVRGSATLFEWLQLRQPNGQPYPIFPGLVVVSMIESFGPSYMWYPRKLPSQTNAEFSLIVQEKRTKFFERFNGTNDIVVLINIWNDLFSNFKTLSPPKHYLSQYSNENSMNNKKLIEFYTSISRAYTTLETMGYSIKIGEFSPQNVLSIMAPIFRSVYKDNIYKHSNNGIYFSHDGDSYKLENRFPVKFTSLKFPLHYDKEVIALITFESKKGKDVMRSISLSLPVNEVYKTTTISRVVQSSQVAKKLLPVQPQVSLRRDPGSVRILDDGSYVQLPDLNVLIEEQQIKPFGYLYGETKLEVISNEEMRTLVLPPL
jgi:hypothetical protein